MRQVDGGNDGVVLDAHLVVVFVALLQAAQDGDGVLRRGLIDHDGLEAAFQRLVLLKIFLILLERRGADASQLAAGQGGLQDVGGVHGALALAGPHEGVYLVDEEDDASLGARHLVDDAFQPFLKLALVFRPGHESSHVERIELLVFKIFGHVAAHDALGQPLDDSRLARTGLADEDGGGFGAAAQNLQHAAYLLVAADDGVELALAGLGHQVAGILGEGLVGVLARSRRGLLPAAQLADGCAQLLLAHAGVLEHGRGRALHEEQGQQEGFEPHEGVALLAGELRGPLQDVVGLAVQIGLAPAHARQAGELAPDSVGEPAPVDAELAEKILRDVLAHGEHARQQVQGRDGLLPARGGAAHGALYGLLGLYGEVVEIHISVSFLFVRVYIIYGVGRQAARPVPRSPGGELSAFPQTACQGRRYNIRWHKLPFCHAGRRRRRRDADGRNSAREGGKAHGNP